MQVIHPFSGTVQRYSEEIVDVNRYRPDDTAPITAHNARREIL
jgi:hypothetical protein